MEQAPAIVGLIVVHRALEVHIAVANLVEQYDRDSRIAAGAAAVAAAAVVLVAVAVGVGGIRCATCCLRCFLCFPSPISPFLPLRPFPCRALPARLWWLLATLFDGLVPSAGVVRC